jgi:hypothetical protein
LLDRHYLLHVAARCGGIALPIGSKGVVPSGSGWIDMRTAPLLNGGVADHCAGGVDG